MNRYKAKVKSIKSEGSLSLIQLDINGIPITSIILDDSENQKNLEGKSELDVIFKETEVVIATSSVEGISMRNQIPGTVLKVELSSLLARLTLQTDIGELVSIITAGSVKRLGIKEGLKVTALIKTNEVYIST